MDGPGTPTDHVFNHDVDASPTHLPIGSDDSPPPLEDIPMYESVFLPASFHMRERAVRDRTWDIEYCVVFRQEEMPVCAHFLPQMSAD